MNNMVYTNCEDMRLLFNGNVSGTTYTFWSQNIASGSVQKIIDNSESYIKFLVSSATYSTTDTDTLNAVKDLCLNYVAFRLSIVLSGGIVISGFDYTLGPMTVDKTQGQTFFYTQLINGFRDSAMATLATIQPMSLLTDDTAPTFGQTSPSTF